MIQNRGLILKPKGVFDFLYGVVEKEVLNPSGQWIEYIVQKEYQKSYQTGWDTYGCVTFSALNCIEILHKTKFGEEVNYSDRFTVVTSDTIPGRGNYLRAVAESIRKDGVVTEAEYPFVDNETDYYRPIPDMIKGRAKKLDIKWEWLHFNGWQEKRAEVLTEALRYGPVQITLSAWPEPENGVYPRVEGWANHAVTLIGYKEGEYWIIFDHYDKDIKNLAWNYEIGTPLLYTLGGEVNLAKKYKGTLIKNSGSPKVYYSNGEKIAHIKSEESFYWANTAGFWGYWDDITEVNEPITEDIIF